ncbi:MAG TPA: hypothetical protein VFJ09_08880 [Nocardioidaceae bacterium]|nr:hypothetical protein [Nocardioidaceae bacterium]
MAGHGTICDFDLHGIVGVRLLDATSRDVATVTRQLGPLRGVLDREPDLTVRFVDRATSEPLTYVGVGKTGFNSDGFFVLRGRHGVPGRALLPMAGIGARPQILCERALPAVPHLLALVNLTALAKGVLPLHASAFCAGDRGVLVTGWAKSGKTESLLAGLGDGVRYVADEWVYLTPDGRMCGVPEPIRLWAWHLDQLPAVLRSRPRADRLRLAGWRAAAALARTGARGRLPGADLLRRGADLLDRQAYLQVPPAELFGAAAMLPTARLDSVVLLLSREADEITVSPAGPREVSGRMAASLADERAPFLEDYRQFRYAFPDQTSPLVETAAEREARLLGALLDGRPAARVAHPYPCDLAQLGAAVRRAALDVPAAGRVRDEVPVR